MLYDKKQLPELLYLKTIHDDDKGYVKYDDMLLDKSLSPYIYKNDIMNGFLKKLQPLIALSFDKMNIIKNLKNYMVDKYYFKQKG